MTQNNKHLLFQFLCVRNLEIAYFRVVCLKVFHEVASRCHPELQSCEGLARDSIQDGTFTWCWYEQEASGPSHVDLSSSFFSASMTQMLALPPEWSIQKSKAEATMSLMTLPQKSCSIISIVLYWLQRSAFFSAGGHCTGVWITRGENHWRLNKY